MRLDSTQEFSRKELYSTLGNYVSSGVNIYVAGENTSPRKTVSEVMDSAARYMADFILDELGNIKEIRYNKVFA